MLLLTTIFERTECLPLKVIIFHKFSSRSLDVTTWSSANRSVCIDYHYDLMLFQAVSCFLWRTIFCTQVSINTHKHIRVCVYVNTVYELGLFVCSVGYKLLVNKLYGVVWCWRHTVRAWVCLEITRQTRLLCPRLPLIASSSSCDPSVNTKTLVYKKPIFNVLNKVIFNFECVLVGLLTNTNTVTPYETPFLTNAK